MKFKNIINIGLVVTAFVVAGTSCKKQDFSNTDPDANTTETVDFKAVLPASQAATATIIEGSSFKFLQNWMGYWARSGSFQDVTDEETYSFTNDFNVAVWNNLYANATNYNFVVARAHDAGAGTYEAIARIMKCLDFQMLVDIYGNVPYSQVFDALKSRTPVYDKGMAIYDSLFIELDRAITLLNDPIAIDPDKNKNIGGGSPNDLIYKGDPTSWIKFANTLKLRMLVHAFQAPGFDVAGKAAILEADVNGFIGAGGSAILNPGYSDTKPNPFYRANVFTETGVTAANGAIERANAYSVGPNPPASVGIYEADQDPRLDRFYVPPAGGAQRGIQYGELAGNPANTGDKLSTVGGPGYVPNGASSRAWILTDFESLFLQSEAKVRGILTTGDAEALCNSGMLQSFVFLGLTQADLDGYTTYNGPDPANGFPLGYPDVIFAASVPTDGGLYTILMQKWYALNGINPLEVWTDWRRTNIVYGAASGYLPGPPLSVNPQRDADAGIPIRLFYPQNEYNYNPDNVLAQGHIDVTNSATFPIGNDPGTGRIFWDIN